MAKPKAKPKAKPSGKSSHGGARPGSGRKPKAFHQLRKELLAAFEQGIVEFLPRGLENLVTLANGGYERVEEEWSPDDRPRPDAGPDDPPAMVLVKRKVSYAEPDRAANQYLIDRVLGRTRQSVEVTDPGAGPTRRILVPDADDRPPQEDAG